MQRALRPAGVSRNSLTLNLTLEQTRPGFFSIKVIAKPLETLQASVAITEKRGSVARVPGKFGGFAITSISLKTALFLYSS